VTESPLPNSDTSTTPLALRPQAAAKAIGIGPRKLWELTADRTSGIPHFRLGNAVLYPVRELQDWLSDRAMEGGK
jgi:hypothetical protein